MTKIYKATPPRKPESLSPGGTPYAISPEADVILRGMPPEAPPDHGYGTQGGSRYLTTAGSEFDLEVNVLDSQSKRPVRAVEVKSGLTKGYTDKLGRLTLRLPTGHNSVSINGSGYVEDGSFTPKRVEFEPMGLKVELDSDEIITLYTSGEIVQGERHEPGNPHGSSFDLETFIRKNWKILGVAGGGIAATYVLTKKRGK